MYNIDKIKKLAKQRGIKLKFICAQMGLHESFFGDVKAGKNSITPERLDILVSILNTTPEYLRDETDDPNPTRKGRSPEFIKNIGERGVRIPVIGSSAAGKPIEAIQEYIDDNDPDTWEEISETLANTGAFVAVKIKGDSMEPRIQDGDIVIVRVQEYAESGDTVLALVNGDEVTCKKIKKRPDGVMLISNNPEYEPMFYTNNEIETLPVRIYGKVVELRGKL